ncbi:MAG: LiaF domain-containing protein [Acidimicrobiales bacterium]
MTLILQESDTSTESPAAAPTDSPEAQPGFPVTPVTLGAMALIGGSAALVGAAGWADIHPAVFIAAGLAVFIGGLVARHMIGGGRGLILFGSLMLVALSVIAIAGPHLDDGTGDRNFHPRAFEEVQAEYRFGIGDSTIDLRDVDFPPGIHSIAVETGIGHTLVLLPSNVNYEIAGDGEIGKVDVFGATEDGFGNHLEITESTASNATVVLDLDMEIGHAEIRRS